jgi:hypothetical protein
MFYPLFAFHDCDGRRHRDLGTDLFFVRAASLQSTLLGNRTLERFHHLGSKSNLWNSLSNPRI